MAAVVMPKLYQDFYKKLDGTLLGLETSEEYQFDDRKGGITLHGRKLGSGQYEITGLELR